jgi:Predicted aminoglycoside phosphotransferase
MDINIKRKLLSSSQENIEIEDLKRIVEKAFGKESKIKSIELTKYGDVNSCYIITTNNPVRKLFLKVENHDLIPLFYSGQIERESASIELLKKHGFPCPKVIMCDITKTDIGKKYMLTEFVEGFLLGDIWDSLTPSEKKKAKEEIVTLIRNLEKLGNPYFGDIYENGNRGKYKSWNDAYSNLTDILLTDCVNAGLLDNKELEAIKLAKQKSYLKINNIFHPCFNHMDIHSKNIIVDRTGEGIKLNAVIDFGNSMFGIPFTDEYRVRNYKFFNEYSPNSEVRKNYFMSEDEQFSCELLFDLECLVFEGMMKRNGGSLKVLSKCEAYLA